MSTEIALKTVRCDGSSVHAPPPLGMVYEIGGTYEFDPKLPAHIYKWTLWSNGLIALYANRPENTHGSRLLIIEATNPQEVGVPILPLWDAGTWAITPYLSAILHELRYTTTRFTVIGEIFVPPFIKPTEAPPRDSFIQTTDSSILPRRIV